MTALFQTQLTAFANLSIEIPGPFPSQTRKNPGPDAARSTFAMHLAVEMQHGRLLLDHRFEMDRPSPELVDVL